MREASKYQAVSTIGVVWTGHRDLGRTTYAGRLVKGKISPVWFSAVDFVWEGVMPLMTTLKTMSGRARRIPTQISESKSIVRLVTPVAEA